MQLNEVLGKTEYPSVHTLEFDLPAEERMEEIEASDNQARFAALGSSWQDQEAEKFAEEFITTMKVLKKFVEVAEKHTPYLLRKAQRIEEYLNQR